jgi:alpha-amylase
MKRIALVLTAVLALSGCSVDANSSSGISKNEVGLQMFMWNWESVGKECQTNLGPAGFDWVLVMPPQNHIDVPQWWSHYQPVNYEIESRLGTRAQFADMVRDCKNAGVKVIADAVINHMVGIRSGTAWTGEKFVKYEHPGLYTSEDFHSGRLPIGNWSDQNQIQNFELLSLSDLGTEQNDVREKISRYLNDLISLGVYGFRIDAARHIPAEDLLWIKAGLPANTYFLQEVAGDEHPDITEYYSTGDLWEFDWPRLMKKAFANNLGAANLPKRIKSAKLLDSDKTVTMVTNHDTERSGEAINTGDAMVQQLAFIYTLASDYGKPMMYSGYSFEERDQEPAILPDGRVANPVCPAVDSVPQASYKNLEFTCQHRWTAIKGMIAWRDAVGAEPVTDELGSSGVLSFGRGALGHIILNGTDKPVQKTVQTQMKPGTYTDAISGGSITVDAAGKFTVQLAPKSAAAISG